jgi:hypothetical protein
MAPVDTPVFGSKASLRELERRFAGTELLNQRSFDLSEAAGLILTRIIEDGADYHLGVRREMRYSSHRFLPHYLETLAGENPSTRARLQQIEKAFDERYGPRTRENGELTAAGLLYNAAVLRMHIEIVDDKLMPLPDNRLVELHVERRHLEIGEIDTLADAPQGDFSGRDVVTTRRGPLQVLFCRRGDWLENEGIATYRSLFVLHEDLATGVLRVTEISTVAFDREVGFFGSVGHPIKKKHGRVFAALRRLIEERF